MTRVIAIRPEPGLSATVAAGREIGLAIEGWPLFEIRAWAPPSPDGIDAVLLGSANAIRHGGPALEAFKGKPVFAVGDTTADAAREAGFTVAAIGEGGLQNLLDGLVGENLHLLRLAGADRVGLAPPAGIELVTRVVYESAALPMPAELEAALRDGALVLAHSAVALRHLAEQCDERGVDRACIAIAALSTRIAAEAGAGWARVAAAENPREAALLALAQDMCH
jgi:uroporphyrinogen-III synthase